MTRRDDWDAFWRKLKTSPSRAVVPCMVSRPCLTLSFFTGKISVILMALSFVFLARAQFVNTPLGCQNAACLFNHPREMVIEARRQHLTSRTPYQMKLWVRNTMVRQQALLRRPLTEAECEARLEQRGHIRLWK